MAVDGAGSVFGVAMRVCRLGATGLITPGAGNMYVTDAMTEIPFGHEYADGDEVEQKNAAGRVCVSYKAPDTLKWSTFGLTLCIPDDALEAMLSGGDVILDGANVVGFAPPAVGTEPNPNGVGIEVWTRAIVDGALASSLPYWRYVFPRVKNLKLGDQTISGDPTNGAYEGIAVQNGNFGDGPANDIPNPMNRVWYRFRDSGYPTPTLGAQTVPAQPTTGSVQGP